MADFNVRVGQISAPEVTISEGAQQSATINRGAPQSAEISGGNEVSYSGDEGYGGGGYEGWQGGSEDAVIDQVASRDMGSLSQPKHMMQAQAEERREERQEPRREAPRHMMTQPAEARHMRQQEQPDRIEPTGATVQGARQESSSRGVPVMDVSDVNNLGVMSSRSQAPEDVRFAAGVDAESEAMRTRSRGLFTGSVPSQRAELEQERKQTAATSTPRTSTTETTESVTEGKPDSEFNTPFGWQAVQREPRLRQPSTRRHGSVIKAEKKRNAKAFNKEGVGYHVYGKVNGLRTLRFRDVGLGINEVQAAIQQNPDMFNRLLMAQDPSAPDVSTLSIEELVDYVNERDVLVATFKPPDNRSQDAQSRVLKILSDHPRGIYLHPVMAAMYTADFDGDDMTVSFDPSTEKLLFDPMEQLIDVFGDQTLNTDFLSVIQMADNYEPGMTARDFIRQTMLSSVSQADGRTLAPLVDAIIALGETSTNGKSQSAAWGEMFRQAKIIADKMSRGSHDRSNVIMERLVRGVYQGMHDVFVNVALSPMNADVIRFGDRLPESRTYSDMALYEVLDGIVEGEAPNNFQDLKVSLTGYLGDVQGKNAPFRFTADVGKVTKMDSRLQIGNGDFVVDPNNDEQMRSLFETTMKYAESHRMAVGYKKAGRSMYYTQELRRRVMSEVGMPSSYSSYKDFIDAFVESYMTASAIINQSNLIVTTTMSFKEDSPAVSPLTSSPGGMTSFDIAEPLLSVYGLHSVGAMFPELATSGIMGDTVDPRWKGNPNHVTKLRQRGSDVSKPYEREYEDSASEFFITNKYSQWSLRKFAHENRLLRGKFTPPTLKDMDGMDNAHAELAVLMAIADKVTGTASKFNEATYGIEKKDKSGRKYIDYDGTTISMMATLLEDIVRSDGTDRMLWINDDIDTLIASNPDMFHHFDMDSPAGFLQSKYAKAMIDSKHNFDVLAGIRLAMVAKWRMERIEALEADIPTDSTNHWMTAKNNIHLAKDELAATSEVWHGIIREMEMEDTTGERSVFQMMREDGMLYKTSVSGERYAWGGDSITYDAMDFWRNPGDHMTLKSVIEDLTLDINTKRNVIADVVRYWENDAYLKSYEVGFQMEIGNDSSYSLKSQGKKSALKSYRDFEQSFNRWGRMCQEALQKDINDAAKKYRDRRGTLMATLQRLAMHPEDLITIDDHMYADSIMSVFDKTYAQTEKAKQQPWTNTVYSALSYQINGGVMNDVERTNDRLVGVQSSSSVMVSDVIRVLADPNESIEVYDEYGRMSDPVTRDDIIRSFLGRDPSQDVESDIWDLLVQNPRLASVIRAHSVNSLTNMDGGTYLGASLSISETIEKFSSGWADPVAHTKHLLRNHPGYGAIISLVTPAFGTVTRQARERVVQTENYLSHLIASAAVTDYDVKKAAEWILGDLGITQDILRDVMKSDYDKYLEKLGLPMIKGSVEETNADADKIWITAFNNLVKYIEEVRQDLPQNINVGERPKKPTSRHTISSFRGKNSFLSNFYDTNVTIDGITYRNAEAAFQAQKSTNQSDKLRFVNLSGKEAKRLGKRIRLRSDWESIKESVMRRVIHAKFSDPDMRRMLEATGDTELIEGNTWEDRTWGMVAGEGRNLLGKILMDERGIPRQGVDISSLASFWDVTQELGGAKTNVSTGVEGAETFRWAEWSSHIRPKDAYASLLAVTDDIDESWNGMWTSEGTLSVAEDGTVTIDGRDLSEFEKEVVTSVPEGYQVHNRSIDSFTNSIPSMHSYMVSKRSNGAEAFNLKAKKAGNDASDSITKMNGRHRMVTDENGTHRASIAETRQQLQDIMNETGDIRAVQLKLAQMMLNENAELGYEDLTLSNYMCIADIMVREVDGNVILRTLPMLFDAIKHRIGTSGDEMSEDELTKAIANIVDDVSETGVGVVKLDPLMVFDGLRPCSKSMTYEGIRPHSSSFERNYSLLSEIEHDAMRKGVLAISKQEARQIADGIVGKVGGVSNVLFRARSGMTARGYDVIGYAGSYDGKSSIHWTIGPRNAIVIGDGRISQKEMTDICARAYKYGLTVFVSRNHLYEIPEAYAVDAMPLGEQGDVLLPMFDMRLNGSEATPYNGGRFAMFQVDPSRYVVSVEDPLNYFNLGDAQYKPTEHFANRVHNIENGSQPISAEELFPNVFKNPDFANCDFSVSLASGKTLSNLIAKGVRCTIDYGLPEGANGWKQRVHDVDAAIERYQARWSEANADGMLMGDDVECAPGDIVAWAECAIINQITGEEQYVLAPIIPFPLHSTKKVPETFTVQQVATSGGDNMTLAVDWTNVSDVTKSNAKYFDSSGGANKGILDFVDTIKTIGGKTLTLMDGTPVDNYTAKASTDSRKVGTDRRVKTMITLMTLARLHGYNFAEVENSFPNDPDVRERLLHERIPRGDWVRLMDGEGIKFSSDKNMDAFLKFECKKILDDGGNPSDYLAEKFTDENGVESHTRVMWEFEAMFERGIEYENSLLKFLHAMDPKFCPNGLDDQGEYLFRLKPDAKDFDNGVVELQVPYPRNNGDMAYSWANVYIGMSFFGEDYSGFSRPNVDGASNFMDAMNTYSHYGMELDKRRSRFRFMWATSDLGRIPRDGGAIGRA